MSRSRPSSPPGLRGRGLTFQLFIFIILPLVALLIAIPFGSLTLHSRAMRALVGERDERAVHAAAATFAEQLNHRATSLRGLALHAADMPNTLASYEFLLPDFEGGLALFTADGALIASSNSPELWQTRPVAELLARSAGQAEAQFSNAFDDSPGGEWMLMVAAAAPDGPTAVGVFSPNGLARSVLADTFPVGDQAKAFVVGGAGNVLYQTGTATSESDTLRGQHPGVAEALRGESGTTYIVVGDSEHVVAYAPVALVGWALVIEEPWDMVDNPLLRTTQAAPLILIPILLFALIALGFGIRQIVQPLRALERQASELTWGRFEAAETPVGGIAEIRNLQAELSRMAQKVKASQQNLRGYLGAITAGQEDERRRLARELHDDTVQALVALDQRAQLAQMAAKRESPQAVERFAELREMIASLIEKVRRIIRALRPIYLEDLGLLSAIEMLARDLETASGARVSFSTGGQPRRLPSGNEIAIYRIVQEALNNAARYAEARSVSVAAVFEPGEFVIRVHDDGKGFAAPERVSDLAASGHYGLMGMQERAELIGGRLTIASSPGAGTTIELRLRP